MSTTVDVNKPLARDPRDRWQLWRADSLGDKACPYIQRWIIDLGPLGSIRLHHWLHDDMHWYDPTKGRTNRDMPTRNSEWAAHDHPWNFLTLMLWGSYTDVSYGTSKAVEFEDRLGPGSVRWRPASWTHGVRTTGAWTLLWTTPKQRDFGFWIKTLQGMRWVKANKWFARSGMPPCS